MSRLAIISANLGGFEKTVRHKEQELPEGIDEIKIHTFTDKDFPPRVNSMTPRLQARIVKMTMWQMEPDFDYYLWVDGSCRLEEGAAAWFIHKLGDADAAFLKHPNRNTLQEEADYIRERLDKKCPYITPRYKGERLDEQMAVVNPNDQLYATTSFICRDNLAVRDLLIVWWIHTSMYHSIDQLSLPTAIRHSGARINAIDEDYTKSKHLTYVRNKK